MVASHTRLVPGGQAWTSVLDLHFADAVHQTVDNFLQDFLLLGGVCNECRSCLGFKLPDAETGEVFPFLCFELGVDVVWLCIPGDQGHRDACGEPVLVLLEDCGDSYLPFPIWMR